MTTVRRRRWWRADRGSLTIFFAIVLPGLIALTGLAADGSRYTLARQRAGNIAREAARAGGQEIDASLAIPGGTKEVTVAAATTAADDYLAAAGITDYSVAVAPDLMHITVTVDLTEPTLMLRIVGVTKFTVEGTATATLVEG
jgi:Flp pilus assembly protein TadG